MENVEAFLRALTHMDRFGGRVVCRDTRTLLVYDLPVWSDEQAHALRRRFPECEVQCSANTHSLSGFIVRVRRAHAPWASVWATGLSVLFFGGVYAMVLCLRALEHRKAI